MRRFLLLGALALLLAGCISIDLRPEIRPLKEKALEGEGRDKILLVDLSGVITSQDPDPLLSEPKDLASAGRIAEELRKASVDDRIKALVVRINSPGGTATGSDIIYRELKAFKARRKVPVVAVIVDVGASGGYYAALAADKIVAHPTAVTGSIGVIMVTVNVVGLLEKVGIEAESIKSGPRKDSGSPFQRLSPEDRAIFQGVINSLYNTFVDRIVQERKLSEEAVRKLGDGRIYTAQEAKALGLVDEIGYAEDAVAMAKRLAGLEEAKVVAYHRPKEYRSSLYTRADGTTVNLLHIDGGALGLGVGPRFLYLWWP